MEKAIIKAIEGGFYPLSYPADEDYVVNDLAKQLYVLEPEFWKGLYKTIGKTKYRQSIPARMVSRVSKYGVIKYAVPAHVRMMTKRKSWKSAWHSFINHLAEGGNSEDFFKELLK